MLQWCLLNSLTCGRCEETTPGKKPTLLTVNNALCDDWTQLYAANYGMAIEHANNNEHSSKTRREALDIRRDATQKFT